ncbi:MAG: sporulation protein [Lachnospiraceae bacterium]|nr:sporulation protein [Lachnospiraceae bacterium]
MVEKCVNISKELLLGEIHIHLLGNKEMRIENYKGIHLYTSNKIIVLCKNQLIHIEGQYLKIQYFSGCDMKITGNIQSVCYQEEGVSCY